jgi:hypothetical protein
MIDFLNNKPPLASSVNFLSIDDTHGSMKSTSFKILSAFYSALDSMMIDASEAESSIKIPLLD